MEFPTVCWVRQNREQPGQRGHLDADSLFQRTKEHCLMGIRGTVRRSHDGDFIHANVDIDLLISEGEPYGSTQKPLESFLVAEHFCLGRRRLHIFGRDSTIRPGWLTIGPELTSSNFDPQIYRSFFEKEPGLTTGCNEKIEALRPKSPPPKAPPAPRESRPPPSPAQARADFYIPPSFSALADVRAMVGRGRAGFGPGWS